MLRIYLRTRRLTQILYILLRMYLYSHNITWYMKEYNLAEYFHFNIIWSHPKRHQFFYLYNIIQEKGYSHSLGRILQHKLLKGKFHKRNLRNIHPFLLFLQKTLFKDYSTFYLFFIYNLTYRHYLFLRTFQKVLNPHIELFATTRVYSLQSKYRRRIKRTVLHMLEKQ